MSKELNIWNMEVVLHPELCAAALANQEADLYFIWSILKALDKASSGKGVGVVNKIQTVIADLFRVSLKHTYSKIKDGIGKYWQKPGGSKGQKVIGLYSWEKVVARLQPSMPRCQPFAFKLDYFKSDDSEKNWSKIKGILVSVIASRFGDRKPQSINSIMEHTKLSRASIFNLLNRCDGLKRTPNYIRIAEGIEPRNIENAQRGLMDDGRKMFRMAKVENIYILLQRIANSYEIDAMRLPLSKRPKAMRVYDAINAASAQSKKYGAAHQGLRPDALIFLPFEGRVCLWHSSKTSAITANPQENVRTRKH